MVIINVTLDGNSIKALIAMLSFIISSNNNLLKST